MRPVKLEFSGVRSYRAKQVIDFTGKNLVAVIGPTGAGKSSLLEAICLALYGSCTWHHKASKELISDGGVRTANVELTFRAQNRDWRVTRSISRASSPPSIHRLEDLATGDIETNKPKVDAKIRALVGFDQTAFLKAVVLPQGRFHELLHASDSERTKILKTLLDLDTLTRIRNDATERVQRLRPRVQELRVKRAHLPDDPETELAGAYTRLATLTAQLKQLCTAQETTEAATTAMASARDTSTQCRSLAQQLRKHADSNIITAYRELSQHDSKIQQRSLGLETAEHQARCALKATQATLAEAEADGQGITATRIAIADLQYLARRVPELDDRHTQHTNERDAIRDARIQLEDIRQKTEAVEAEVTSQKDTVDKLKTAAAASRQHYEHSKRQLEQCRQAHDKATTTRDLFDDARKACLDAKAGMAEATQALSDSRDALARAKTDREANQRRNAAAHAAEHSAPGDLCPVCTRQLPAEFSPPHSVDEAADAKAVSAARSRATQCESAHREKADALARAEATVDRYKTELEEADGELAEAQSGAAMLFGDIDLDTSNDELLDDLEHRADTDEQTSAHAQQTAHHCAQRATQMRTKVSERDTELNRRHVRLQQDQRRLTQDRDKIEKSRTKLPGALRPASLSPDTIHAALDAAQAHQGKLDAIDAAKNDQQQRLDNLHHKQRACDQQRRTEIDIPAKALARRIQHTAHIIAQAEALNSSIAVSPPSPPDDGLAAEQQWASHIIDLANTAAQHCEHLADHNDLIADEQQQHIFSTLEAANVSNLKELQTAITTTKVDKTETDRAIAKLSQQRPHIASLDTKIKKGQSHIDGLTELADLLKDSSFTGAMVQQRQQVLLATASTILESMTDSRYTFTGDFRILDNHSYETRNVRTLSGGETFQASLALALAVVDLATRQGGRAEALFLDEGFATLDTQALDTALAQLEQLSQAGRLVTVISHIKKVAEYVPDVLIATKTPITSTIRWATPSGLDHHVNDDLGHLHD